MKWIALVALVGALVLGATALDKNDEQSCKDRYAADVRALPVQARALPPEDLKRWVGPEPSCESFLPW